MPRVVAPDDPIAQIVQMMVPPKASGSTYLLPCIVKVALAAQATPSNGGTFSVQNPFEEAALVALVIDKTTGATGIATIDAGVVANATSTGDNLIDGKSVQTAEVISSFNDGGTNGKGWRRMDAKGGANDFVTGTVSADSSGLVGSAYLIFIPTA